MDYIAHHPNREEMKVDSFFGKMIVDNVVIYAPNVRRVLDIGCGRGYLVDEFNKQGLRAYGTDLRTVFETDKSRFVVSDIRRLPFGDSTFDLVCETFTTLDIWQLQGFSRDQVDIEIGNVISEVYRVLRPDGYFFALSNPDVPRKFFEEVTGHSYFPLFRKTQ
jgi:SAM-dependent methyltransferase